MAEQMASSTRANYFTLVPTGAQVLMNVFYDDQTLRVLHIDVSGLTPGGMRLKVDLSDANGTTWVFAFDGDGSAVVDSPVKYSSANLDGVTICSEFIPPKAA